MCAFLVESYEINVHSYCEVTAVPSTFIKYEVVEFPVPACEYITAFEGRNGIIITGCFLIVFVCSDSHFGRNAFGHYTTVGIKCDNPRSLELCDSLGLNITTVSTSSALLTFCIVGRLNSGSPLTEVSMCALLVESYESDALLNCIVTGIPVTLVESVVVCFPVPACEYITNLEGRNGIIVTSCFLIVFVVVDGELKESAFRHYTTVGIEGDYVILFNNGLFESGDRLSLNLAAKSTGSFLRAFNADSGLNGNNPFAPLVSTLNGSFDYGQAGAFAADSKTGSKFNTARGRILIVSAAESYNRCAGCFIKREYVVLFKICRATNCDSITDSYVTAVHNNDSNTVGGTNCTAVGTVELNVSTVNDKSVAGLVSDIEAVNINFNILLCGNSVRTGLLLCKKNDLVTCYSCVDCILKCSISCAAFDICLAF